MKHGTEGTHQNKNLTLTELFKNQKKRNNTFLQNNTPTTLQNNTTTQHVVSKKIKVHIERFEPSSELLQQFNREDFMAGLFKGIPLELIQVFMAGNFANENGKKNTQTFKIILEKLNEYNLKHNNIENVFSLSINGKDKLPLLFKLAIACGHQDAFTMGDKFVAEKDYPAIFIMAARIGSLQGLKNAYVFVKNDEKCEKTIELALKNAEKSQNKEVKEYLSKIINQKQELIRQETFRKEQEIIKESQEKIERIRVLNELERQLLENQKAELENKKLQEELRLQEEKRKEEENLKKIEEEIRLEEAKRMKEEEELEQERKKNSFCHIF